MATSVHGDDFTTEGPKVALDWFKKKLEEKYELTEGARLGGQDQMMIKRQRC